MEMTLYRLFARYARKSVEIFRNFQNFKSFNLLQNVRYQARTALRPL